MSRLELYLRMRQLWMEHVFWTRLYLISFADNLPDAQVAAQRLLRNQEDIGNLFAPFYGQNAGAQLTALLKTHITEAVALLAAAKAGNLGEFEHQKQLWFQNADQIAAFLSRLNPAWSYPAVRDLMFTHLNTTLAEADARIHRRYAADRDAFDRVEAHILQMADALSGGIVRQHFSQPTP